jgi:hypothetical protein
MYCGKDCQTCGCREEINCGGCLSQQKDCIIAQCCVEKGHENCGTCGFRGECYKLRSKDNMPSYIQRQRQIAEANERREAARAAEAQRRQEELVRRAPVVAKWLGVMFWLTIVTIVINLVGKIPSLALACEIMSTACSFVVVWALLQLKEEDSRYRTAAICTAVSLLVGVALTLISGGGETPGWTLALSLPAAVVSLVGTYNKCMAHSSVVGGVDSALGEKWEKIWKWQIIALGSLAGSIVLLLIAPVLGALVAMAAAIATLVVSIMEMVALYQSAEAFKKIS